jgi:hypothetical protein
MQDLDTEVHSGPKNRKSDKIKATTLPVTWRDSISRPIAPVSSVADGDYTTRPRRLGQSTEYVCFSFQ